MEPRDLMKEMKEARDLIHEHWDHYKELMVDKTADEIQVAETKKAFYSGAWTGLHHVLLLGEKMQAKKLTQGECLKQIQSFRDEVAGFIQYGDLWHKPKET